MALHAERGSFEARRRKEQVAFLVVKFLRMHIAFKDIAAEFHARLDDGTLASAGLFRRVSNLAQSIGFDLKELAHTLFRLNNGPEPERGPAKSSDRLATMKAALERRFLDSSIGTGYHLLLILLESLYQIERYSPELDREVKEIDRVMELSRAPKVGAEQRAEMENLQALDEFSGKLAQDSTELAQVVIRRCEDLLDATARVIRRFASSAHDNEILVLNLLRNHDLVKQVYGEGADEAVLAELCLEGGSRGRTGMERALALVRARCGNLNGLVPAAAS
jgi:hypothetical protein